MRISDWSSDVCSSDLMASWMIDRFGAQPVKDKYLPDLVTMATLASYCLTEPSSGSDAAALRTKAVRDGDHYVVTGTKQFISGGGENDLYVVMVRKIGSAHVCTPVTNAHLVCRILLEQKKTSTQVYTDLHPAHA